jgi:hypothetical protein
VRDMHIDEAVAAGGVFAFQKDRISVSNQTDVGLVLIFVGARNRDVPPGVIGRNRRGCPRRGARGVIHFATLHSDAC